MAIHTHKVHGWTRRYLGDGSSRVEIVPTDGSGTRIVRFLSAHSWANDPNDDKAKQAEDRVVLLEGAPLPGWAMDWLTRVNARSCENGRETLRRMMDDADDYAFRRDSWSY